MTGASSGALTGSQIAGRGIQLGYLGILPQLVGGPSVSLS